LKPTNLPPATGSLAMYLSEIRQYPLLTKDEEQALARSFCERADARSAHALVTSNLRFVVKVAYEYRSYGLRMADLIQEGNIGLMKGVQKFNPDKGIRLISYAVWWIRAYIQNHILRNWSLVKLGTTQAQRKLFFSLARTKREIERMSGEEAPDARQIAKRLRVRPTEVQEMERRIDGRDLSLDSPMGDETGSSHVDFVPATAPGQDEVLAELARLVTAEWRGKLARVTPLSKRRLAVPDEVLIHVLADYRYRAYTRLPNMEAFLGDLRVEEWKRAMKVLDALNETNIEPPEEEDLLLPPSGAPSPHVIAPESIL